MDGRREPLRDGDWALFEWARGLGLASVEGRVVLVAVGDENAEPDLHIKRVVRETGELALHSDNPEIPDRPAAGAVLYARLVRTVRPEALAPAEGSTVTDIAEAFGLSEAPSRPVTRIDGHLFLLVEGPDALQAPDRWPMPDERRPGETAFVLARSAPNALWTYLGVGRFSALESGWRLPPVSGVAGSNASR